MEQKAIADQIERIASSNCFANKRQLKGLLCFLFSHIENQAGLKPDRICRHLWPGYAGTNPSVDLGQPISRLRSALQDYYESEGRSDPIVITLPDRSGRSGGSLQQNLWIVAQVRSVGSDPASSSDEPASTVDEFTPDNIHSGLSLAATNSPSSGRPILAIVIGAAIVCLSGIAMLVAHRPGREPTASRLDGGALVVMNAQGKELWKVGFSKGFSAHYYQFGTFGTRIWFGDLDRSGHSSVLFLYQPALGSVNQSTTLICYSYEGKEKWRWTPGRVLPELSDQPAVYEVTGLAVLNSNRGRPARIAISSAHVPYYPAQVALIDPQGHTISEYWHSGHLDFLALTEPDAKGHQDIVVSGVSNGYHQATLVVLDPDHLSGASVERVRPEIQIRSMGTAREKLRLLFPRSDLNLAQEPYNAGREITVANGAVSISVLEDLSLYGCRIWYSFDKDFTLRSVDLDDQFRAEHVRFFHGSLQEHAISAEEESHFLKVQCVSGCAGEFIPVDLRRVSSPGSPATDSSVSDRSVPTPQPAIESNACVPRPLQASSGR